MKKNWKPHTGSENMQLGHRNGIWHRKIHHVSKEKRQTTNDRRNRTTKSRKISTPGEKETSKYLGIMEADTIKQEELKEKLKKNTSRERKIFLETKQEMRSVIKEINRNSGPFLKWTRKKPPTNGDLRRLAVTQTPVKNYQLIME